MKFYFALFLLQVIIVSCNDSEINDDFFIPSHAYSRAGGDGKYDLLGYGYDCLYALGDNDKGAFNQVIDVDRYERGEAIDPLTGQINTAIPGGKVEIALSHGDFVQHERYAYSLSEFYKETNVNISSTKPILWGKIELSSEYDTKINEKKVHSFYKVDLCRSTKRLYFNTFNKERLKYFLTDNFRYALKNYTAKQIVDDYGTHVLTDINVGGKLSVLVSALESDLSKNSLVAFTNDFFSTIKAGSKEEITRRDDLRELSFTLIQRGGSDIQTIRLNIPDNGTISGASFDWNKWVNGVSENTSVLIYSNTDVMIPIWDLIDDLKLKQEVISEIEKRSGYDEKFKILSSPAFILVRTNATQSGNWCTDNYITKSNYILLDREGVWKITAGDRYATGGNIKQYLINNNNLKWKPFFPPLFDPDRPIGETEISVNGNKIFVELGQPFYTLIEYNSKYPNKGRTSSMDPFESTVVEYLTIKDIYGNIEEVPITFTFDRKK